ncbi:ImmA/IrrE family metallo-endopeptidase [Pararhizobium haloflavum]|uniref:ImmA/IrrE family metallo-endopeptidase n=1 Tax=Pararhizobium haloflavum TaxID=2037914 RepID=UPI000C17EB66|nr:ImmA/IrrE family metallo-endopeptidase [Pararhizobium haloflavum]
MTIAVHYPEDPTTGAPRMTSAPAIWMVAAQVRRQLVGGTPNAINAELLMDAIDGVAINGYRFDVVWDSDHPVHDDAGQPVFGVCETDHDTPGQAYVSVNGPLLAGRPDLLVSTAAHELGHVIFDVPAGYRRYRAVTSSAGALLANERVSEWRANEFMGALLAPAFQLHRELLRLAQSERLRLVRAPNHGRPGCPVVCVGDRPDAFAGVVAALAERFNVSDSFVDVRLRRYGLVADQQGARS